MGQKGLMGLMGVRVLWDSWAYGSRSGVVGWRWVQSSVEHEDEDEHEWLRQADKIEEETGPEIEHAAPGVANLVVASGSE
jgi:hypothetical protein